MPDGNVGRELAVRAGERMIETFLEKGGDLIKMIRWDGQGACLFPRRLERGRFVRPTARLR